jgi:hypothetical protein
MGLLFVGVILGLFVGVGLAAGYLALSERELRDSTNTWIDKAIKQAFEAVDNSIEKV